jgi:hypothetical protein
MEQRPFTSEKVKTKFDNYPEHIKPKMLFLRELIFKIAASIKEVGKIEEVTKWGEPSYVTAETKSGSTIRIDWKKKTPHNYYLYVNCNTTLINTFKQRYGNIFKYDSNRSLIFHEKEQLPIDELSDCIATALTYQLSKKKYEKNFQI